jgi:antitoxin Phd
LNILAKTAKMAYMKRTAEHRRSRPSRPKGSASFTATEAKNAFGSLLEAALRGDMIVITKHSAPKAVLISVEEFNSLSNSEATKLQTLTDEFDAVLDRLQSPNARAGLRTAFAASPQRLGRAAVKAARKRA